jgi:hypothetical protein
MDGSFHDLAQSRFGARFMNIVLQLQLLYSYNEN